MVWAWSSRRSPESTGRGRGWLAVAVCASLLLSSCYPIPERSDGINLFPLFRYARSDDDGSQDLDLLWPLIHVTDQGDAFYQAWVFPFYFRTRDLSRDDLTVVPLFGVRRHGPTTRIDLIPFLIDSVASVSLAEDSGDQRHHLSGLRLLFNEVQQVPGGLRVKLLDLLGLAHLLDLDTGRVGFPGGPAEVERAFRLSVVKILELVELFQCSNEGAYDDIVLLELAGNEPISLFRSHRRHTADERAGEGEAHLFPFYFAGRSAAGKNGYWHLWPFYGMKWAERDYAKHYFLYPVFSVESAPSRELSGFELLWPLVAYRQEAQASQVTLFGLLPIRWGGRVPSEAGQHPAPDDAGERGRATEDG